MAGTEFQISLSFYEQLRFYYDENKGKIRRNYKDFTKKFLDYNNKETNPKAFLRKPQFEALEMYVFIKEFMNNQQVYEMFDDWRNKRNNFSDASYYSKDTHGQIGLFTETISSQTETIFKQMKNFSEKYPNYIYALTMGLGKTILMATCIFYDFLLANKYPKDPRFCHNALVFAPDKTVLQSLKEIITFDKTLVIPPEYARILDTNIKIHFLDESGTTLNTLDDSDFNIIISNTQKIIVKKKHKEDNAVGKLFNMPSAIDDLLATVYGDDCITNENDLTFNQRFMKLCRLPQIGIYVDEAHHLFGNELEKSLRTNSSQTSLRNTINLLADELVNNGTQVIACYNYTGTPYVKQQVLPEVVYSYGLRESINNYYLKEVDVKGYDNVKNEEFLRATIIQFWEKYGNQTYEGLNPKLAIFASKIEELQNEVKPIVEKILAELNIPISKILVNVGDSTITKNDDIRNFNNLDVVGSEGDQKQFILLVGKGTEGWNCRSLFGVALFRSPSSKIFVLQATMRCLRKITDVQQTASVFLSKDNFDILQDELKKNFNMQIKDLKSSNVKKKVYKVRVLPPPRIIKNIKSIKHTYKLHPTTYSIPVNFGLKDLDLDKYKAVEYNKTGISQDRSIKEKSADEYKVSKKYSSYTIVAEITRYLNISCILIEKILRESVDGIDLIVGMVSQYNEILTDVIIPKIFYTLNSIEKEITSEDRELVLLKEPEHSAYYEFVADPNLVITNEDETIQCYVPKSFHADTYCFDSAPEKECFLQYLENNKVKEVYFTGMFTSGQGDFSIQYFDPESQRIRNYYPDFLAKMDDGSYQIIEVKADNQIDNIVVRAKAEAAREIATESSMEYVILPATFIMKNDIFETENPVQSSLIK